MSLLWQVAPPFFNFSSELDLPMGMELTRRSSKSRNKPYKCSYLGCNKSYYHKPSLINHQVFNHGRARKWSLTTSHTRDTPVTSALPDDGTAPWSGKRKKKPRESNWSFVLFSCMQMMSPNMSLQLHKANEAFLCQCIPTMSVDQTWRCKFRGCNQGYYHFSSLIAHQVWKHGRPKQQQPCSLPSPFPTSQFWRILQVLLQELKAEQLNPLGLCRKCTCGLLMMWLCPQHLAHSVWGFLNITSRIMAVRITRRSACSTTLSTVYSHIQLGLSWLIWFGSRGLPSYFLKSAG